MSAEILPVSRSLKGLSASEVGALRERYGENVFSLSGGRGMVKLIWNIIREPMFLILLFACFLYFIVGEVAEGLLMLTAMVLVTAISFYQDMRSTRALNALEKYTEPLALVVRDGIEQKVSPSLLVPGDLVIAEEGSLIPADAKLLQSNDLTVSEAILTGESMPVEKHVVQGDDHLFQGTLVSSGRGYATVIATGNATRLGKLGKSVMALGGTRTLLERQIGRFVRMMALMGAVIFCLIWLVDFRRTGNMVEGLLLGLTLAMSIIPEEIPVALSSFMALGAYHMARRGMIVRQPKTVEHLGAVSVICLDKTGTITQNRMTVAAVYDCRGNFVVSAPGILERPESQVLYFARLASEKAPFDAMEQAIAGTFSGFTGGSIDYPEMVHEYPLEGRPPMMTHVYLLDGKRVVAAKGAPERIMTVCKIDEAERRRVERQVSEMAEKGYRVLGVCSAVFNGYQYPTEQGDFAWEMEGLLAFYDPPREGLEGVFEKWMKAGISVKLVTGDYKETARTVAIAVGLPLYGRVVTGDEVLAATEKEVAALAWQNSLFVRMFPEAKLRLVQALKGKGEVVAMMGDGVNDGPALKAADVGIAMGDKGTEIARLAAALVLTDDDLGKVSGAILEGRKIYANLKKAIRYIVSIHIPIIVTASLPLLLNWRYPALFSPIHVIFLELIMGPTCSIFFEREPGEPDLMRKPPGRRPKALFLAGELFTSMTQGIIITLGLLGLYYYFMQKGEALVYVRTLVFITLVIANIFLTFMNRTPGKLLSGTKRNHNTLSKYVVAVSLLFLSALLFLPFIRGLFGLVWLGWAQYLLCLGVGLVSTGWIVPYKMIRASYGTSGRKALIRRDGQR